MFKAKKEFRINRKALEGCLIPWSREECLYNPLDGACDVL